MTGDLVMTGDNANKALVEASVSQIDPSDQFMPSRRNLFSPHPNGTCNA